MNYFDISNTFFSCPSTTFAEPKFHRKFCESKSLGIWAWYVYCEPLVSEATALPTEAQPLPQGNKIL